MGKSEDALRSFVDKKSSFLDLPDGAEAEVKYLGAEAIETRFNGAPLPSIRYQFEHGGVRKSWDRSSREFAKQMMAFKEGDVLRIKRSGQRNATKYFITKVN